VEWRKVEERRDVNREGGEEGEEGKMAKRREER
jgi:hypothetical protein